MTDQLTVPHTVPTLVRMHHLLTLAEIEARAVATATATLRDVVLASALEDLTEAVRRLFPDGVMPAFDEWPQPAGANPVDLARQAEQLARLHPIQEFPPGMGLVMVQLIDTVRDFS